MLKIMKFLRIIRLLRVVKLRKLMYKIEDYISDDALNLIMDSFKILIYILGMCHWIGCMFHFVAEFNPQPDSWVRLNNLQDKTSFEKYCICIYFAFTTIATVGYCDIHPETEEEKVFGMIIMIVACGFFAFIIGSIGGIVNRSSMISAEFKLKSLHIS